MTGLGRIYNALTHRYLRRRPEPRISRSWPAMRFTNTDDLVTSARRSPNQAGHRDRGISKVGIHTQLNPPIHPCPIIPPLIIDRVIAPPPKIRKSTTTTTNAHH